ncbi:MAG: DNA-processing protein DprA [Candidatus Omnitrophota bacterium]
MKISANDLILLNSLPDFGYKKLSDSDNGIARPLENDILRAKAAFNLQKELDLIKKEHVKIITIFDKEYPDTLKNISSPPIVLYVKGNIENITKNSLAVVGSRSCTQYGIRMTKRICAVLAKLGITICSGLARGIDTVAHKQALAQGAKTIAVLGSGLNNIYPPENRKLSDEIQLNGALISEFPMDTPPLKENFPRRNRIISGLSKGVLVVEAPEKSGALITADFALKQGKDVFAVCANADSDTSLGCNNLIKQGAKLTLDASDIIEELFPELLRDFSAKDKKELEKEHLLSNISEEDKVIYKALSDTPVTIDSLIEGLSLNSQKACLSLLNLEMTGLVKQLPGKLYVRV